MHLLAGLLCQQCVHTLRGSDAQRQNGSLAHDGLASPLALCAQGPGHWADDVLPGLQGPHPLLAPEPRCPGQQLTCRCTGMRLPLPSQRPLPLHPPTSVAYDLLNRLHAGCISTTCALSCGPKRLTQPEYSRLMQRVSFEEMATSRCSSKPALMDSGWANTCHCRVSGLPHWLLAVAEPGPSASSSSMRLPVLLRDRHGPGLIAKCCAWCSIGPPCVTQTAPASKGFRVRPVLLVSCFADAPLAFDQRLSAMCCLKQDRRRDWTPCSVA